MGNSNTSTFNASTTAEDVLGNHRLDGQVVIVTGGNSGIGKETARVLAGSGAHIIICARNSVKSNQTCKEIIKEHPNAKIQHFDMDLSNSKSIDQFIIEFGKLNLPLHVLINNAGVITTNGGNTSNGFEYVVRIHVPINSIEGSKSLGHLPIDSQVTSLYDSHKRNETDHYTLIQHA
jgi:NAD(P)-dependent dehydrogenase (short-subunit alcohol dehydrogenase family)